jgi:heme-degrading monooxygenase HmoA
MIVRLWRGRAGAAGPRVYIEHFRRSVLPALERIDGFRGATLLREQQGGDVELLVLTRWASMDAIRAFAGKDIGRAVVEPEAVAALASFDERVHHYEIVADTAADI